MNGYEPFLSLAVALAVGLLIGFERERSSADDPEPHRRLGGARTHPLVALSGALGALLVPHFGWIFLGVGSVALLLLLGLSYWVDVKRGDLGLTSEFALLLTFFLGVISATPGFVEPTNKRLLLVLAIAVVVTLLLSVKAPLHSFVRRVSSDDLFSTLKFLLVAIILLPLLPDRPIDPWQVLNPRTVGLLVVLISGLSFIGFVAIRLLGPHRGLGVTGLVGGLVSSTAVTLSSARRARTTPDLAAACALAVVAASSVMFVRVLVTVAVVNRTLFGPLTLPMGAMALAGLTASGVLFLRARRKTHEDMPIQLSNPFELSSALKFALLFALVLLVSKLGTTYLGPGATYLTGLLAGIADVDAITLSMANLAARGLEAKVAVTTILIATISNTLVKGGISMAIGRGRFGRYVAIAFGVIITAGAVALTALWTGDGLRAGAG